MEKFLNFYTKYPWVAVIIMVHWFATAAILITEQEIDATTILGISFLATVIYAYFGFKVAKA